MDLSHQPKQHPKLHLAPPTHPSDVLSIPRWGYATDAATMGKSIGLFQTCAPGWAYIISPVQQLFPCLPRARLGGKHLSSLLKLQSLPPVCIKCYKKSLIAMVWQCGDMTVFIFPSQLDRVWLVKQWDPSHRTSQQQSWKQGHESRHSLPLFQQDMFLSIKIFPCACCCA